MNLRTVALNVAIAVLSGLMLCFALAGPLRADDSKSSMALPDAPAPVRDAIAKLAVNPKVTRIVKETDSRGRTMYDVEYEAAGQSVDAEISEQGEVIELATKIDVKTLPAAASKAIAAAFPNATIDAAEAKQVFFYEVLLIVNGKKKEIALAANGQFADDDEDDDDEDEEEEEEEDDDDDDDD